MVEWLRNTVVKNGCVAADELDIFTLVETPKEVVSAIKKFYGKA